MKETGAGVKQQSPKAQRTCRNQGVLPTRSGQEPLVGVGSHTNPIDLANGQIVVSCRSQRRSRVISFHMKLRKNRQHRHNRLRKHKSNQGAVVRFVRRSRHHTPASLSLPLFLRCVQRREATTLLVNSHSYDSFSRPSRPSELKRSNTTTPQAQRATAPLPPSRSRSSCALCSTERHQLSSSTHTATIVSHLSRAQNSNVRTHQLLKHNK